MTTVTAVPAAVDEQAAVWELVQRAQGGDPSAFAALYDRYADTIFRYVYKRVGHRQTAEDLTSEVWLRMLRRVGSVTELRSDFGAWLVTIARNLVADHFKSGRHRLECVSDALILRADTRDRSPEGDPEGTTVARITRLQLRAGLAALKEEQRRVLSHRYLQGRSVGETAAAMGLTEGAVKALTFRAIRSLGRHMLPQLEVAG